MLQAGEKHFNSGRHFSDQIGILLSVFIPAVLYPRSSCHAGPVQWTRVLVNRKSSSPHALNHAKQTQNVLEPTH